MPLKGCDQRAWQLDGWYSPETTVTGPQISASFWRVKFLIKQRIRVLFPTLGGPTTTISTGGGSEGLRSTPGMWCFLVFRSWALTTNTLVSWLHTCDERAERGTTPVEGLSHANRRLNSKRFGVTSAFIFCRAFLLSQLLLFGLWPAVFLLMLLLFLSVLLHRVHVSSWIISQRETDRPQRRNAEVKNFCNLQRT